ncbi:EFR1 family ferrodoxin [Fusibacter tunisiensis]|uniref:Ferredoxin n=1 Tax=Fusibacter tunisiensis TaxID=1008308 RepID=A0ABS2MS30_9FIRM|nr:EFR1 family ferrodoxin [Fusibacter tunisiensis]MBM7562207.1 NAD-dependent dihydropyrimidine dehydrogenase PreA subunit [Fusibacter tunisiensis]
MEVSKEKIAILYFSGTGNTAYVVNEVTNQLKSHDLDAALLNMETFDDAGEEIVKGADVLFFAYPVHGSMAPMFVWEFVRKNAALFDGKKGVVLATQWFFSGDGGAYLARILKKCNMDVIGIEHFKINNNLSDVRLIPIKNGGQNDTIKRRLNQQIELFVLDYKNGKTVKIGNSFWSMLLGAFQRIPFSKMERKLSKNVKIDRERCTLCGLCVEECPTQNLYMADGIIKQHGKCTLCYRCVNHCPTAAISIMSKNKPKNQYRGL